jgi:arabinan endo-1,5-alpha-L-arabinosidase
MRWKTFTKFKTTKSKHMRTVPRGILWLVVILFEVANSTAQRVLPLEGDIGHVHDPSIIKERDIWYIFSTATGPQEGQVPVRCSKDLLSWAVCGQVFSQIPDWIKSESPKTRDLWAPDISYFAGEYHLYYVFSVFGRNTSGIALATNKTLDTSSLDFHWVDRGLVLRSRAEDDFNAIDPNLVFDNRGRAWLSFGSFWTGIKIRRIDPKTGLLSAKDTTLYSLAKRMRPENPPADRSNLPSNWQAIEAPFIVKHDKFYYLFVSFDFCCRGVNSNYKTMVGRSRKVTGPYLDADGKSMLEGGGTCLLLGNDRWVGPGGESVLQQKDGDIIVFHAYDAKTGIASLQISTIYWKEGWPHAALEDVPAR